jgi:hypothetical protein
MIILTQTQNHEWLTHFERDSSALDLEGNWQTSYDTVDGCEILHQLVDGLSDDL